MGIYATKTAWQRALRPVVRFCAQHGIHPDVFTYAALALAFLAGWALWRAGEQRAWLWLVPVGGMARLLLNLMDGLVARELGLAGAWGEVKNEFGDRVADVAIFLGLGWGGYADPRLLALALALILCVSYLGILGKALTGKRIYAGVFGKGDRMISLALFTVYPLVSGNLASYNWYLGFAALAAIITIAQRLKVLYDHTESPG